MSQALSTISSLISRSSTVTFSKPNKIHTSCLNVRMISVSPPQNLSVDAPISLSPTPRRNAIVLGAALGIAVAALGLNISDKAWAAARRPPPKIEDDKEKKDPNVSGVLAKVLASKKRKEAMKQAMAEQRMKGKKIEEPSNSSPPSQESPS